MFEKYKFIEKFRLHAAAYLMVDLEPPPDEYNKPTGQTETPAYLFLKDKPVFPAVDAFLEKFLMLWHNGGFGDVQVKFEGMKSGIDKSGYETIGHNLGRELIKRQADPHHQTNTNLFYPIELTRPELKRIADIMGLKPAFLQEPADGSAAKVKKEFVTEKHVSRQHQQARERCREVASRLLKQNPKIQIHEAINHQAMLDVSKRNDGNFYLEKIVRGWIKDLFPEAARKHGRRPKR